MLFDKQKKLELIIFLLLLSVLIFTRFYKLGSVPHGMTWDEAAIGYNGYAVITTRRDEWLERLPVSFQSFGDYKAPLAIYVTGIFTTLFGSELWILRLPFALSGVMSGVGMCLLAIELFATDESKTPTMSSRAFVERSVTSLAEKLRGANKTSLSKYAALSTLFFVTLSPWHHHFSRAGFESGMALTFVIWGLYFFVVAMRKETLKFSFNKNFVVNSSLSYLLLFTSSFVLSLYTYHSSKIFAPMLALSLLLLFWKEIKLHWCEVVLAVVFGGLLLVPLAKDSLYGNGLTRAGSLAISADKSLLENVKLVAGNFVKHLSPSFLLFGETSTLRHGDGTWGVLLPTTLLFFIFSLFASFLVDREYRWTRVRVLALAIIFAGILPAALGDDVPHSNRALLALPGFLILASHGLLVLWQTNAFKNTLKNISIDWNPALLKKQVIGVLFGLHALFFISYLNNYYTKFARESADSFKDGYVETFELAKKYEKGEDGFPKADQIVFTDEYGQPYIYALYVRRTDPIWYRGGSLNNYLFTNVKVSDLARTKTLVVSGKNEELPREKADHLVYGSDGTVRFALFWTGE